MLKETFKCTIKVNAVQITRLLFARVCPRFFSSVAFVRTGIGTHPSSILMYVGGLSLDRFVVVRMFP